MKKELFIKIVAYVLSALFVYASVNKLAAYSFFLHDLERSPMLSSYAKKLSVFIPAIELIIAAAVINPRTRYYGFIGSTLLMAVFTLYVGYVAYFTRDQPCSCGGIIRNLSWPQHFIFNVTFLMAALVATILSKQTIKTNYA